MRSAEEVPTEDTTARAHAIDDLATLLGDGGLSLEDRAAWRDTLGLSDDCERAFEVSYAGEGAGLELFPVGEETAVITVLCSAGAYQPSFLYYYLDLRDSGLVASPIEFPTYESADGQSLTPARRFELWGEPTFLPESGELTVLRIARQTGDCGTWARYGFDRDEVELRGFRARLPCPAEIQSAVDPQPGLPPPGWRSVDEEPPIRSGDTIPADPAE